MSDALAWFKNNLGVVLFGAVTLIQISPIKINPWSWLGKTIRRALVGDLEAAVKSLTDDFTGEKVASKRWRVLDFANSCRQARMHTH